jgi:hypothetical protein
VCEGNKVIWRLRLERFLVKEAIQIVVSARLDWSGSGKVAPVKLASPCGSGIAAFSVKF